MTSKLATVAAVVILRAMAILRSQAFHPTVIVDSSKMYNGSLTAHPDLILKIFGPVNQRIIESL